MVSILKHELQCSWVLTSLQLVPYLEGVNSLCKFHLNTQNDFYVVTKYTSNVIVLRPTVKAEEVSKSYCAKQPGRLKINTHWSAPA
jgi:hypothetical protein